MARSARESESQAPWLPEPKSEAGGVDKSSRLSGSLERFAERAADALGALLGAPFAGALNGTEAAGTFALFAEHEGHSAAVLRSDVYDTRLALILSPTAADVTIAAMFGADPALDPALPGADAPTRPRTQLETRLLADICGSLAAALNESFAPGVRLELAYEGLTTLVDTNLLGARDMQAIATEFNFKAAAGTFGVNLILPQSLTTELSDLLSRGPEPEAVKLDPHWTRRMEQRVAEANLTLTAILDEFNSTLGEVSGFTLGQVLPLNDDGQGQVRIECVERGVFVCKLGERNHRYALEVEDIIAMPAETAYPAAAM